MVEVTMVIDATKLKELKIKLEQQRRQIDEELRAIELVERLCRELEEPDKQAILPVAEGKYGKLTLNEACVDVINNSEKEEWRAREVTDYIKAGGYRFQARNAVASVSTTLRRLAQDGKLKLIKHGVRETAYCKYS